MSNPEQAMAYSRRSHEQTMLQNENWGTYIGGGAVIGAASAYGEVVNLNPLNRAYFSDNFNNVDALSEFSTTMLSIVLAGILGLLLHLAIKRLGKTFEHRLWITAGLMVIPVVLSVPFIVNASEAGAGAMSEEQAAASTGTLLSVYARAPIVLLMALATAFACLLIEEGWEKRTAYFRAKRAVLKLDEGYEQYDNGLMDEKTRERRRNTIRLRAKESFAEGMSGNEKVKGDRCAALAKGEILGGQDFIEGIGADLGKGLQQYHPDMQDLIRTTTPASIDLAMIADGTPKLAQAEKNILVDHLSSHRIAYSQRRIFSALKNHA